VQLWNWTASKTNSTGRLLLMAGLAGVLVAALALPVVAATGILVRNTADKFTATAVNTSGLPQRSAIYDASGHLITYVYGVDLGPNADYPGFDRQPVSFNQISKAMQVAIVSIEDARFWSHGALDIKGTVRALVNDLQGKPVQGGSTLEQQYVKDVLVLQAQERGDKDASAAAIEDTLSRKLDQLREAVEVADTMTKPQILAGYLNDAYFGNGAYGIEAAAETYFDTTAANLNLVQAATLAGIVENPDEYDPYLNPAASLERRNTVLATIHNTTPTALGASDTLRFEAEKLALHNGTKQSGCSGSTVGQDGFFCDDVMHTLMLDSSLGSTTQARAKLLSTGGLSIYTTLNEKDQSAATKAVNYVLPKPSDYYNPANNAAAEVLVQPGTGKVQAIAEDRKYGTGSGETEIDYAVDSKYGGGSGVQTGSSSKLFTLITALEQGVDFGFQLTVPGTDTVTGYTNCQGQGAGSFPVSNSEGSGTTTDSLYTGTTDSINVFYAHLEQRVGLCATVKTAVEMGVHRADGTSLLDYSADKSQDPADDDPSFTLGVENVSPMTMAAAYAVPASGGTYCAPIVLTEIETDAGQKLGVPSAGCHQVISLRVAEAVNYILQGVLTQPGATGALLGGIDGGYEAAAKTGTSNVASGNGTPYAAFAGYTTSLVGYVSVFNPKSPTTLTMTGLSACYRLEYDGRSCPGEMFGADAPGSAWHMTFDHASLSGSHDFEPVPAGSALNDAGNGQVVKQPAKPKKSKPTKGGTGKGTGGGGNGFLPISTGTAAAKKG
jgi:membrane peptidoglycan carboxypeptidase